MKQHGNSLVMDMPNRIDIPAPERALNALIKLIGRQQFNYTDEKVCQEQMESFLATVSVPFYREYRTEAGIIDFFFPRSGIAAELKASKKWSRMKVYRQCERYCGLKEVKGLLLLTARAQKLPPHIEGKPVKVHNLGISLL